MYPCVESRSRVIRELKWNLAVRLRVVELVVPGRNIITNLYSNNEDFSAREQ